MTTPNWDHVLIDIEDTPEQLYHRTKINDIAVLVDATPEDDPEIIALLNLLSTASALLEACKESEEALDRADCQFFACPGPSEPDKPMATCYVCSTLRNIRAVIAATKG